MGFWIGQTYPPRWNPDENFRWIPCGTLVRYLSWQVRMELAPEQQIALLLRTLRHKLLLWSSTKLSSASPIVMANNVLLSTILYAASILIFKLLSSHLYKPIILTLLKLHRIYTRNRALRLYVGQHTFTHYIRTSFS